MDVMLVILIGIPAVVIVLALVVQLRREAHDRRPGSHLYQAEAPEHPDENAEAGRRDIGVHKRGRTSF